jgi:hypothetical protein
MMAATRNMIQPKKKKEKGKRKERRYDRGEDKLRLTRPVGTWSRSRSDFFKSVQLIIYGSSPDHDADHHDDATWCLDHHHRYAERADQLETIGVDDLGSILQGRENGR